MKDHLIWTLNEGKMAIRHITFVVEAEELSAVYSDYGERFYNSLETSAEKFLNYAKLHPDFFSLHETEFENLISTADPLGYGVSDDLGYMMENVRIELGYYDDPDGDKWWLQLALRVKKLRKLRILGAVLYHRTSLSCASGAVVV